MMSRAIRISRYHVTCDKPFWFHDLDERSGNKLDRRNRRDWAAVSEESMTESVSDPVAIPAIPRDSGDLFLLPDDGDQPI